MQPCNRDDCLWFGRCVVEDSAIHVDCYVKREPIPAQVTKRYATITANDTEHICDTRAHVALYLNGLPITEGFIHIRFHQSGVTLSGTRSTFIRAARNGTLWTQGSER